MSAWERSAFDLDLSAFEPAERYREVEIREPNRVQLATPQRVRGRMVPMGNRRQALDAPSKRAMQRALEREAEARQSRVKRPSRSVSARADHLPAEPSPQARKERSRENCKERPDPAKKRSGTGAKKSFVPWCDRKR